LACPASRCVGPHLESCRMRTIRIVRTGAEWGSEFIPLPTPLGYVAADIQVLAICFNAALLRITRVAPFTSAIWRFLKSAKARVTVSRELPIICAISS
jgi:hypothetical protein